LFDEFIAKWGENMHGITLLLIRWLREVCGKHDKFYQRGRACTEKGGVEFLVAFSFVVSCFLSKS
jgi:hypothetical protein